MKIASGSRDEKEVELNPNRVVFRPSIDFLPGAETGCQLTLFYVIMITDIGLSFDEKLKSTSHTSVRPVIIII